MASHTDSVTSGSSLPITTSRFQGSFLCVVLVIYGRTMVVGSGLWWKLGVAVRPVVLFKAMVLSRAWFTDTKSSEDWLDGFDEWIDEPIRYFPRKLWLWRR